MTNLNNNMNINTAINLVGLKKISSLSTPSEGWVEIYLSKDNKYIVDHYDMYGVFTNRFAYDTYEEMVEETSGSYF